LLGAVAHQYPQHALAAHPGHHQVEDDEVEALFLQHQEARGAIRGAPHGQAVRGQRAGHEFRDLGFVVDDEDARHSAQ
jgi:hypothetical protein